VSLRSALRSFAALAALALGSVAASAATPATGGFGATSVLAPLPLTPAGSWMDRTLSTSGVRLQTSGGLDLLQRFARPWIERPGEWRRFFTGRYGPRLGESEPRFAWTLTSTEPRGLDAAPASELALGAPGIDTSLPIRNVDVLPLWRLDLVPSPDPLFLSAAAAPRCQPWQRPYVATIARYGGEFDSVQLLDCDGAVSVGAVDSLSVLARPPGAARPELPLPLEPEPSAEAHGEWVNEVRLLDPRLIWVVARLSEAFPHRVIYVISGYRRDGHGSFHTKGRALDLFVMGVRNEDVFRVCHELKDVACGFYPNNKFLHVDVRPPGTGHAVWVDVSRPGQPSRYVDSWPGVVSGGALAWGGE